MSLESGKCPLISRVQYKLWQCYDKSASFWTCTLPPPRLTCIKIILTSTHTRINNKNGLRWDTGEKWLNMGGCHLSCDMIRKSNLVLCSSHSTWMSPPCYCIRSHRALPKLSWTLSADSFDCRHFGLRCAQYCKDLFVRTLILKWQFIFSSHRQWGQV